ncbi:MAG: hypothetical protein IKN04_00240 [Clostridia bacterium]|nr:hypothetical protein [Clostridia bacterium]
MAAQKGSRVTPDELILMHQLYNKYHSYAWVAREIGRSASCVSYNIKMKRAPKVVRDTFPDTVRE